MAKMAQAAVFVLLASPTECHDLLNLRALLRAFRLHSLVWRPLELEVEMKKFSVSLSLVAVALCAGCATEGVGLIGVDAATGEPRVLYCKDGAYVTKSMGCGAGVERVLPLPPAVPVR